MFKKIIAGFLFSIFIFFSGNQAVFAHGSSSAVTTSYSYSHSHASSGHGYSKWYRWYKSYSKWYRWYKKPKCHVHSKPRPHLHSYRFWWNWRVFRHLRKHWGGSSHCKDVVKNQLPTAEAGSDANVNVGDVVTSDNDGGTATDTVVFTVDSPVVNVAPDAFPILVNSLVNALDVVNLDGSTSIDSDGTIVSYQWSQTSGVAVDIVDADTATASFIAPVSTTVETLTFDLTVIDNNGASDTESLDIEIVAAIEPTITMIDGGGTVQLEDDDPLTLQQVLLTVQVDDIDSSVFMYQWTQLNNGSPALDIFFIPEVESASIDLPEVDVGSCD